MQQANSRTQENSLSNQAVAQDEKLNTPTLNQQQQQPATNDNNKQNPINSSQLRPKFAAVAATAYLRHSNSSSMAASVVPLEHIRHQSARPMRPNLRRQVMVATSESLNPCTPIELAGVLPMRSVGHIMVPPKRPARLPTRFVGGGVEGSAGALIDQEGGPAPAAISSNAKPNRYSWAQVQQWQQAAAQRAAAAAAANPGHPNSQHHHFSSPFSSAASRVLVVNPMQIVNLSEHTKSRLIKFIEAVKRFSEKWFSHVLLLLFLAVYACFGAYVFISFEAPTEQWEKQLIIETRLKIVNDSWFESQESGTNREQYTELFRQKFEDYERLLNRACASGMTSSSLENQWTFWNAIFYSMTVFTTIGYGHLTPITFAGRVATMVYAIFGIPILLMVLADLGKLLTRIIKYAFKKFRYLFNRILRRKRALKTRKLISDNTNQYIGVARNAFERGFTTYIQRPYERRMPQVLRSVAANGISLKRHQKEAELSVIDDQPASKNKNELKVNVEDNEMLSLRKNSVTTDILVTPGKQTKPVSPAIKSHSSDHHNNNHHSHHHSQQQHHHHHAHQQNSRSHSPGKRKSSTSIAPSMKKQQQHNQQHHNQQQQAKSSLSRSSSSSLTLAAQVNIEKQQAATNKRSAEGEKGKPICNEQKQQHCDEKTVVGELISRAPDAENNLHPTINDQTMENENLKLGEEEEEDELLEGEEDEDDEDFDIPVSFALFLLVTYMMFGAVVFSIWEGWNFFDALYFVFISMSTIGFGDLVPQHPKRMIGTFIYLLFGLALTSMCINVVQEKIHATFLRAKMQIGEKMGLDLEQIMADDYYHDEGSIMGCEPSDGDGCCVDDGSHSVAVSQHSLGAVNDCSCDLEPNLHSHPHPNSMTHSQQHSENQTIMKLGHNNSLDNPSGVRLSKSRDSLKSTQKKRSVTGLPGHNNAISSGSLRRKSSQKKMICRQPTPSSPTSPVTVASQQQQATEGPPAPTAHVIAQPKAEIEVRKTENLLIAKDMPSINQPVRLLEKGTCQPLRSNRNCETLKSDSAQNCGIGSHCTGRVVSQPTSMGHKPISKSLSSETRQPPLEASNLSGSNPYATTARGGAKSAGSSRRSSVSQELNQLDDLIVSLSQTQANSERFGPLLGIPSSRRSSRSNSPSTLILVKNSSSPGGSMRYKNYHNSNSSMNNSNNSRRGTSMTLRPTHQKQPVILSSSGRRTGRDHASSPARSNSNPVALEELDTIKYSAV